MVRPGATDVKYIPRALERIDKIREKLGERPALFLDFDGTLAPLADNPSRVRMPQSTRTALRALVQKIPVAVVSGRSAIDVRDMVGLSGVIYSGSHGQEINFPDNTRFEYPESVEHVGALDKADRLLTEELEDLEGVRVERKPFALAVYTRFAQTDEARDIARKAAESVGGSTGLRIQSTTDVLELRPPVDWDKGKAITYLLGFLKGGTPLFIADDDADEDGFVEARRRGGVSIVVEKSNDRLSTADYRLMDTYETTSFLNRFNQVL
ncbi:MAG: trehalose-phosphatase [Actinobacteria bacterium]|nr:MAG: trehalose-phosphatase [Actinomycetota bacterium]